MAEWRPAGVLGWGDTKRSARYRRVLHICLTSIRPIDNTPRLCLVGRSSLTTAPESKDAL